MTVEFDNIKVEVNDPAAQKKIKGFILKATNQVKTHRTWTDEEKKAVKDLAERGVSYKDIAPQVNRTPASVYVYMWKNGLIQKKSEPVKQFTI